MIKIPHSTSFIQTGFLNRRIMREEMAISIGFALDMLKSSYKQGLSIFKGERYEKH